MIKFIRKAVVGLAISYAASTVVRTLEEAQKARKAERDNRREEWGVGEEGLRNALRRASNALEEMKAASANLAEEVRAYEEVFGKVDLEGLEKSVVMSDWKVVGRDAQSVKLKCAPGEGDFEPTYPQHEIISTGDDAGTHVAIPARYEKDHDKKPCF